MTLGSEQRFNLVAMYEGHALQAADNQGSDGACDLARCAIDGNFNALLRLEGVEVAAQYAFALADRVVGRLKVPTSWPPQPTIEMAIAAKVAELPAPVVPNSIVKPREVSAKVAFGLGWLAGYAMESMR